MILALQINILERALMIFCTFMDTEPAVKRCSWEKMFWKYVEKLQENTHAEVRFQ